MVFHFGSHIQIQVFVMSIVLIAAADNTHCAKGCRAQTQVFSQIKSGKWLSMVSRWTKLSVLHESVTKSLQENKLSTKALGRMCHTLRGLRSGQCLGSSCPWTQGTSGNVRSYAHQQPSIPLHGNWQAIYSSNHLWECREANHLKRPLPFLAQFFLLWKKTFLQKFLFLSFPFLLD